MQNKTILLFGCFSFMGYEFLRQALGRGYIVHGVDALKYPSENTYADYLIKKTDALYDNFSFIARDIFNVKSCEYDYAINFAAESHVTNSIVDSAPFIRTNVDGVRHILDLVKSNKDTKFIQISTDEVYGDIGDGSFFEDSPLNPSNPYAASKAAADLLIKSYARTHGIQYNIIRPTNNFGALQYKEKLIPMFLDYLKRGEKFPLHNRGEPIRTWTHCSDTASAVIVAMESWEDNQIFNCSGEYEESNISICNKIAEIYFGHCNFLEGDLYDFSYSRPGQDIRYSLNCEKLKSKGWKPKTPENFPEMLEQTIRQKG